MADQQDAIDPAQRKKELGMTPERKAELRTEIEAFLGPLPRPKPKVVVSDGVPVRDADVVVSPKDPNARRGQVETVSVRRADYVDVNIAAAEAQHWDNRQAQANQRRLRKE